MIDISYTLNSASHTVGRRQAQIEAGSQALVVPTELTRSTMICVFCRDCQVRPRVSGFFKLNLVFFGGFFGTPSSKFSNQFFDEIS